MTFLKQTAEYLWNRYGEEINKICIVLPNKRAGIYLKKHFADSAARTIWAPQIITIEELISEFSGLHIPDNFTLLFDLYNVHKKIDGDKSQSFEEFMNWGQTMLRDFNDLDSYLADAENLYKYLDATRVMSLWNPDGQTITDFQKRYLHFYNSMLDYYRAFREKLSSKRFAYPGMASREVAENLENLFKDSQARPYIFAGFNALTNAEEKIIRFLEKQKNAEIIWDSDLYYMDNAVQEAGHFLRKYRSEWELKDFRFAESHFKDHPSSIKVIGVPGQTGQVKMCGDILEKLPLEETSQSCVVLADEGMLIPLLNSIPPDSGSFNITMGFPLQMSALNSLINAIFKMHETSARLSAMRSAKGEILYLNDVISVLAHPYISGLTIDMKGNFASGSNAVASSLRVQNRVFLTSKILEEEFEKKSIEVWERISFIFLPWKDDANNALGSLALLFDNLRDHLIKSEKNDLDIEFVFQFSCLLQKIKNLLDESGLDKNISLLRMLFDQLVHSSTVPFYGEPLSGFQIMGVLETRTLDFKNLIMLSVNDDIIPAGRSTQSFIPFDIRIDFHLPTYKEKEAVYAYHFYRLLQRSENVWLIYNTEAGNLGGGDRSRFISQLLHELPEYNKNVKIEEQIFTLPPSTDLPSTLIKIEKSPDIIELMRKKAFTGFSPSSLNAYLNCSLKFYFQELIGLKETEEIAETMDAKTLGSAIHKVLQILYTPYLGESLKVNALREMQKLVSKTTTDVFSEIHPGGDFQYGKNLLILRVAQLYLRNFLAHEESVLEELSSQKKSLTVKHLEVPMVKKFEAGEIVDCEVKFKGFADRIDLYGDKIRIIDYKTGAVNPKDLALEMWDDLLSGEAKVDKSFQLLMYAYLWKMNHAVQKGAVESGIISFRSITTGFMPVSIAGNQEIDDKVVSDFGRMLQGLVQEMFNPDLPIIQTMEDDNCTFCPYRFICYKG
jgi:ATP-dependent helicase/nuclease subunit B